MLDVLAGPTYEKIDPVRFLGNNSSGKMGFELANTATKLGASVFLISGPTNLQLSNKKIKRIDITSSDEMFNQVKKIYKNFDIIIMSAAVADFKPKIISNNKIKKKNEFISLDLEKTRDILSYIGTNKSNQFIVGFALETDNEFENAKTKLHSKNLDLIVLNSLKDKGAGFGFETNKVSIIDKENKVINFPLKSKELVSYDIFNIIIEKLNE